MGKVGEAKSKVSDAKKKVSGYLSAIRTMLDNYPQPQIPEEMNNLLNANSPIAFVMGILRICGCTPDKLLAWISEILCGQNVIKGGGKDKSQDGRNSKEKDDKKRNLNYNKGYGVMDGIEEVVKVLLLANIKNMFTCSLNPFIPNDVMKDPNKTSKGTGINGNGIKIPIKTIDLYNVLSHSPNEKNKKGKSCALYFDVENYNPNEMWKSTDFNAFLWYVMNRGTNTDDGEKKMIWDNRCRLWNKLQASRDNITHLKKRGEKFGNLYTNFFDIEFGNKSYISINGKNKKVTTDGIEGVYPNRPSSTEKDENGKSKRKNARQNPDNIKKHQYFIVNYSEKGGANTGVDDYLTIWLNADRYVIKTDSYPQITYNKTVFEFNFDFIQHIRLFDSRVIASNIVNSLLGIANTSVGSLLGGKYSLEEQLMRGKIGEIVKEVINNDITINECSFSFSNDDYDELLNKTQETVFKQEDIENITASINDISNSSTMEEAKTKINESLTKVAEFEFAKNGDVEVSDLFSFGQNIILKIIEECVVQIVMQVLGPKVMLVFAVNAYFMGDITNTNDFEPKAFLIGMHNLIFTMIKQIYEIILKQLIQFLIDEIRPLITLMIEKLLLERVRFYIDLLKRLLALIKMFYNAFNNKRTTSAIDNVNYADIAPIPKEPEETC